MYTDGRSPTANRTGQLNSRYCCPTPPTNAEQEAIAEALSDADALIESLEQLIAKKRHLKQGAMQELLTGKQRLPGFSGEWEVKRLGEIAEHSQREVCPLKICSHATPIEQRRDHGMLFGYFDNQVHQKTHTCKIFGGHQAYHLMKTGSRSIG